MPFQGHQAKASLFLSQITGKVIRLHRLRDGKMGRSRQKSNSVLKRFLVKYSNTKTVLGFQFLIKLRLTNQTLPNLSMIPFPNPDGGHLHDPN